VSDFKSHLVAKVGKVDLSSVVQIEYNLKRGTTDNSYIIQAGANVALIDVPDQAWNDAFVKALQGKASLDKITHLILGHFSPKRGDSLVKLLKGRSSGGKSLPKKEEKINLDFIVRAAVRNAART
jgi:flavorubredoxin